MRAYVIRIKGGKFLSDWGCEGRGFEFSRLQNAMTFGDKSDAEYNCNNEIDEALKPKVIKVNIEIVKQPFKRRIYEKR